MWFSSSSGGSSSLAAIVAASLLATCAEERAAQPRGRRRLRPRDVPADGPPARRRVERGLQVQLFPPTSGPHYPPGQGACRLEPLRRAGRPARARPQPRARRRRRPVRRGRPAADGAADRRVVRDSPDGLVVAPLPESMPRPTPPADWQSKIFLTAWTHLATCSAFDEDAFDELPRRLPRAGRRRAREVPPLGVTAGRPVASARRGGGTVDAGDLKSSARKGV